MGRLRQWEAAEFLPVGNDYGFGFTAISMMRPGKV